MNDITSSALKENFFAGHPAAKQSQQQQQSTKPRRALGDITNRQAGASGGGNNVVNAKAQATKTSKSMSSKVREVETMNRPCFGQADASPADLGALMNLKLLTDQEKLQAFAPVYVHSNSSSIHTSTCAAPLERATTRDFTNSLTVPEIDLGMSAGLDLDINDDLDFSMDISMEFDSETE
eukprot:GFYU01013683.1.p1 GENE.GFYU01013683.1~~GFYU01013683.1.p1  ORF type:complete len:180 (+),score=45.06 GFYU01013683.1:117-656(+)